MMPHPPLSTFLPCFFSKPLAVRFFPFTVSTPPIIFLPSSYLPGHLLMSHYYCFHSFGVFIIRPGQLGFNARGPIAIHNISHSTEIGTRLTSCFSRNLARPRLGDIESGWTL